MLEKLKSEGAYQKVFDEMQKQYDEFLKSKIIARTIDFVYSFLKIAITALSGFPDEVVILCICI